MVNDVPKHQCSDPTDESHAIVVGDPDLGGRRVILPLHISGVTSYLPVYKPTKEEYESGDYIAIEMTSETLDWDPLTDRHKKVEDAMVDGDGRLIKVSPSPPQFIINAMQTQGY